ncbi:hypothetical protein AAFP30_05575 [Gordonia sp. CPCC 205515]|uniref:hypothetical protein n=1 Tax=Gordonia sp. CPCC 205515 TaxID=3140791 RepID=UPI003AF3EF4B
MYDPYYRGDRNSNHTLLIAVLIAVLVTLLVLLGIGAWYVIGRTAAPSNTAATEPTPQTVTAPAPPPTVTETKTVAPQAQAPAAAPVPADAGTPASERFTVCPSGRSGVATSVTSCAFADNVRDAWMQSYSSTVLAYSPVTETTYSMSCSPGYVATLNTGRTVTGARCTGGNDAVVIAW